MFLRFFAMLGLITIIMALADSRPLTNQDISIKKRYEHCRDKLFTVYPAEVNKNQWNNCMERTHGKNL